ncbi:MAG: PilZ domain-containing protein [Gemmatimonadetes bacterium]|nr:PilZ domain-containing protein [Gemmatimonadota bacterium]
MSQGHNKRDFYRVYYPPKVRPKFNIGGVTAEVIDASERGVAFRIPHKPMPELNSELAGTIRFHRREVDVSGVIMRVDEHKAVLLLDPPGIPMQVIVMEQQRQIASYPDFRAPS